MEILHVAKKGKVCKRLEEIHIGNISRRDVPLSGVYIVTLDPVS
jgi:hypothetical protein